MEGVNASQSPSPHAEAQPATAPRLYTWISETGRVIEQVRVVPDGDSARARGRIVSATHPDHEAFTLDYEAEIDTDRALRQVHLTVATEGYARTIDLSRDGQGAWTLQAPGETGTGVGGDGGVDLDVTYSVFFTSVMIRRLDLDSQPGSEQVSALTVDSHTLDVTESSVTLSSDDEQIHGITATAATSASVDSDGMIVDVPGLSRRV